MTVLRNIALFCLGFLLLGGCSGCQLLHELQPHRLQRWNRGTGMESGFEAYYSVEDPIPERNARNEEPGFTTAD